METQALEQEAQEQEAQALEQQGQAQKRALVEKVEPEHNQLHQPRRSLRLRKVRTQVEDVVWAQVEELV